MNVREGNLCDGHLCGGHVVVSRTTPFSVRAFAAILALALVVLALALALALVLLAALLVLALAALALATLAVLAVPRAIAIIPRGESEPSCLTRGVTSSICQSGGLPATMQALMQNMIYCKKTCSRRGMAVSTVGKYYYY